MIRKPFQSNILLPLKLPESMTKAFVEGTGGDWEHLPLKLQKQATTDIQTLYEKMITAYEKEINRKAS
jgi:hypothetical protein